MKHCIIVKWKPTVDKKAALSDVSALFSTAVEIPGVKKVKIIENMVALPNRYDLMIRLTIKDEALQSWNESSLHRHWKELYGDKIESKAIFDY